MPETSRTFANLEIKQGEDYELTIAMDSGYTTANKTYRARIVKDFDGTILYSELDYMKAMDKKEGNK